LIENLNSCAVVWLQIT